LETWIHSVSSLSDFPAVIKSTSPEETIEIGKRIAFFLSRGSIVALKGALGTGKTCLTKGIAMGLGIKEEITSPTYTIIAEYESINPSKFPLENEVIPVYHIDAYRLRGDDDFCLLGGEEIIYGNGISIIEWSDNVSGIIPPDAIVIEIKFLDGDNRLIAVNGVRVGK